MTLLQHCMSFGVKTPYCYSYFDTVITVRFFGENQARDWRRKMRTPCRWCFLAKKGANFWYFFWTPKTPLFWALFSAIRRDPLFFGFRKTRTLFPIVIPIKMGPKKSIVGRETRSPHFLVKIWLLVRLRLRTILLQFSMDRFRLELARFGFVWLKNEFSWWKPLFDQCHTRKWALFENTRVRSPPPFKKKILGGSNQKGCFWALFERGETVQNSENRSPHFSGSGGVKDPHQKKLFFLSYHTHCFLDRILWKWPFFLRKIFGYSITRTVFKNKFECVFS